MNSVPKSIQKSMGKGKSYNAEERWVEGLGEADLSRRWGERSRNCSTSRGKKLSMLEAPALIVRWFKQLPLLFEGAALSS